MSKKSNKKKKIVREVDLSRYNKKVLNPFFKVWIGGKEISLAKRQCITSVSIKETVEGSDSATLKISDPEFVYLDDNIFIEDKRIKIKMGWSNTKYRITFDGYISAVDIEFSSSGIPEISITCMDKTYNMNKTPKNKTYKNTTSANVVKQICKKYGFKCVVEKGYKFTKEASISQSKQTDIAMLTKLAGDETYPFTARLVGDTFYYEKIGKLNKPKISLTYRNYPHSLISFSPKINVKDKSANSSSSTVNSSSKKTSTSTGSITSNNTNLTNSKKTTNSSGGGSTKKTSYTYNPALKKWKKTSLKS